MSADIDYIAWAEGYSEWLRCWGTAYAPDWLTSAMLDDPRFDHGMGWAALEHVLQRVREE